MSDSQTNSQESDGWEDCSESDQSICGETTQKPIQPPIRRSSRQISRSAGVSGSTSDSQEESEYDSEYDSESFSGDDESDYSSSQERSETHESQKDIVYWYKQREQVRVLKEHPLVQLLMTLRKPPDRVDGSPSFYHALNNYQVIDLTDQKTKFLKK